MSVDLSTRTHGLPGTYTAGCRCADCRRAWADYAVRNPSQRAYAKARDAAVRLVQESTPDLWEQLLNDAYDDLGAKRRAS